MSSLSLYFLIVEHIKHALAEDINAGGSITDAVMTSA